MATDDAAAGIEVVGLCKAWPSPDGRLQPAVRDLHFTVRPGEVVGLLGPNGAGKTTTLRMLVGLELPDAGSARLGGVDVVRHPRRARRRLGYLSTTSGLPARLTVREALETCAVLQGVEPVAPAVEAAGRRFDLLDFFDKRVAALSTGMLQRSRLAAALVHDPPLLVLDEPASGLDVVAAEELLRFVTDARDAGAAVLLSTHVIDEAQRVCDRVVVLLEGEKAAEGTPGEVAAELGVESLRGAFRALVRGRRG